MIRSYKTHNNKILLFDVKFTFLAHLNNMISSAFKMRGFSLYSENNLTILKRASWFLSERSDLYAKH